MLSLGFCYFLFLFIDIRLHIQKAKKAVKDKENRIRMFEEQLAATQVNDERLDDTLNVLINVHISLRNIFKIQWTLRKQTTT